MLKKDYVKENDDIVNYLDDFVLADDISILLVKLLEYIPENWNVSNVDTVSNLSADEIEHLRLVRRDYLISFSIRNMLKGKDYDENFYRLALNIDIDELIDMKFGLDKFDILTDELEIKGLAQRERTIEEECLLYLSEKANVYRKLQELSSLDDDGLWPIFNNKNKILNLC